MKLLAARELFLVASALAAPVGAQWPLTPVTLGICTASGNQALPKSAAGGDGSTWFAWFDDRGGSYAVYAQKVNAYGYAVLAQNGLRISANPQTTPLVDWSIDSDGAGGCVLAFTDIRAGGDQDVYVYRIDGAGNFLWGPNGIPLSNNSNPDSNPRIARLTDGSFAVTWARSPSPGPGPGDVHVQKLDANGVRQFPGDGLTIVGIGNERPALVSLVASDAGGWIVSYVRDTLNAVSLRHYRTQKFDSAGNAVWNGGVPLTIFDGDTMAIGYQPVLESDGIGGAVYAWQGTFGIGDCWFQRVSSFGIEMHPHDGMQVSTEFNVLKLEPRLAVVAGGDVVVAFNKRNVGLNDSATCVQRIDSNGARLWTNIGIELNPMNGIEKKFERVVAKGNDAIVLTCQHEPTTNPIFAILGYRVDGSGANVWAGQPVVLTGQLPGLASLSAVTDAVGGVRAFWHDNRNVAGDVYALNLTVDGTLGPALPVCGAGFCFAISGLDPACPCANFGWVGNGCANSLNPRGANLVGLGVASITNDTVTLYGSGMPNSSALYFQGTTRHNGGAGAVLGDGLRCAGGQIVRLGTKTNSVGWSAYPALGDLPLAARGAVTMSGSRTYQVWYRNAANYCTASTFNLSNGFEITWGV